MEEEVKEVEEVEESKEDVVEEQITEESIEKKDVTDELIGKLTEEEKEEKKGIPTQVLTQFSERIDNIICLLVNKLGKLEKNKLTPEEVKQTQFSQALIEAINHYFPEVPVNHPLTGVIVSGAVLGGIVIEKVKAEKEGENDTDSPDTV